MAGFGARLFDVDRETGITTIYHDDGEGGFTLEELQDVEPILELNKARLAGIDERAGYGEWSQVASIPLVVWAEWAKEGDVNDPAFLRKKLNDRANLFLRTRPGRV